MDESMFEDLFQSSSTRLSGNAVLGLYSQLPRCGLCNRYLPLDNGDDDFEVIRFCGDCNFLISENPIISHQMRAQRSRRRRYRSSERNLSHIAQAGHFERDTQSMDGDSASPLVFQHFGTRSTPSQYRRWRVVLSDSETDVFDSLYGDSESNISISGSRIFAGESDTVSYSAYGGESDASVDGHSFLENEFHLGTYSDPETDSDIDPMNAGLYHWNSDDEDEEDIQWEEIDVEENGVASLGLGGGQLDRTFDSSGTNSTAFRRNTVYLTAEQRLRRNLAISFTNIEEREGHVLAEMDILRREWLPTATSFINNLPQVVIQEDHENVDDLACAICKDCLSVGTIVKQLPCLHIYHSPCILPWLSIRNSCPLCRFELPTDSSVVKIDTSNRNRLDFEELDNVDHLFTDNYDGENERRIRRSRWSFLAAVLPVIGIVGIALGLCVNRYSNLNAMVQHSSLPPITRNTARRQRWLPFPF